MCIVQRFHHHQIGAGGKRAKRTHTCWSPSKVVLLWISGRDCFYPRCGTRWEQIDELPQIGRSSGWAVSAGATMRRCSSGVAGSRANSIWAARRPVENAEEHGRLRSAWVWSPRAHFRKHSRRCDSVKPRVADRASRMRYGLSEYREDSLSEFTCTPAGNTTYGIRNIDWKRHSP
jgi:hypothetical protein